MPSTFSAAALDSRRKLTNMTNIPISTGPADVREFTISSRCLTSTAAHSQARCCRPRNRGLPGFIFPFEFSLEEILLGRRLGEIRDAAMCCRVLQSVARRLLTISLLSYSIPVMHTRYSMAWAQSALLFGSLVGGLAEAVPGPK